MPEGVVALREDSGWGRCSPASRGPWRRSGGGGGEVPGYYDVTVHSFQALRGMD